MSLLLVNDQAVIPVVPAVHHGENAARVLVEGLRQEGYTISSAPNRGYRLEDAPDKLRAGELSGPLAGALVGSRTPQQASMPSHTATATQAVKSDT